MDFKDYYSTLGVSKTATDKEIKQAYRKLARKFHPDVNPGDAGAEARFKEVNEAHEVLSDPAKRKKYDELGANWRMYDAPPGPGGGAPFGEGGTGPQYTWSTGGGFRPMSEQEMSDMFGGDAGSPFSDFFKTFFGGMEEGPSEGPRRRGRPRAQKGRDVEHPIELDVEEAFRGSVRRLSLRHDGHARNVEVRIPAGVTEGSRVRVAGEGGHGTGSAPAGDLYLRVQLKPHPLFEVKGRDVFTKARVPVLTAVLGGEVDVVTPEGRPLRLKVPSGTQAGQKFRLRGHGFPALGKPAERGDLYATVDVDIPKTLTDEERKHYEALAALRKA